MLRPSQSEGLNVEIYEVPLFVLVILRIMQIMRLSVAIPLCTFVFLTAI